MVRPARKQRNGTCLVRFRSTAQRPGDNSSNFLGGANVSGGRASRDKGNRLERALVHALQDVGFAAERVPLSGAARGRFGGDLSVPLLGTDRRVEVKCRGNGFRQLYDWLDGADFLIVRADRQPPLVVLPFKLAAEIAAAAERSRSASSNSGEKADANH
jgi:hypothetical protein